MFTHRLAAVAAGALLLAGSTAMPDAELRAQSYSSGVRLPAGRAALVRTLLNSVSARRRAEAAEELGETADPRVLEALATAAAHDSEPDVRRAARRAIRQIRGDRDDDDSGIGPIQRPASRDPNVTLVDSWYQRYLGRSADRGGLASNVGLLQRGVSPEEVQGIILGSDEFWENSGGTVPRFVGGLYRVILNRDPTRREVEGWVRRYAVNRANRSAVAQEFLAAAQQELLSNQGHNPRYPY
jgi:HEAT repeat protein